MFRPVGRPNALLQNHQLCLNLAGRFPTKAVMSAF
jgi:hypothetical protein